MKRILLFCVLALQCVICIGQKRITEKEACLVAIARLDDEYKIKPKVRDVTSWNNDKGVPLMYEVETDFGLSVIVSGNMSCYPILCTHSSSEGSFFKEFDSLPCGIQFLLELYAEQIDSSFLYGDGYDRYFQQWDTLMNGIYPKSMKSAGRVRPMLKSDWGQHYPNNVRMGDAYNYYIEGNDYCEHCIVGCVGVALGQVMYYWNYPLVTPIIHRQFDWCQMVDRLDTTDGKYEMRRDNVAYLLNDCAKSVNASFGCNATSAYLSNVDDALIDRYGYDNHADYKQKIWYSNSSWKSMLYNNLNNGHPVIYRGQKKLIADGGHAFVCDGYNEYGEFHFNFGWNGAKKYSYFKIDSIVLADTLNYNYLQGAVFDIYPKGKIDMCDYSQPVELFYWQYYFLHSFGGNYNDNNPLPPYLPKPYEITPQTMTTLKSADASVRADFRTIPAGATAKYQAHKEIVLQDGFEAEWGSDFTAEIVPCQACEEPEVIPILTAASVEPPTATERQDSVEAEYFAPRGTLDDYGFTQADIHPNPTTGELTISTDGEVDAIVIYNATGSPVGGWHTTTVGDRWLTLDVSSLTRGTYIVALRTGEGVSAARFVKW